MTRVTLANACALAAAVGLSMQLGRGPDKNPYEAHAETRTASPAGVGIRDATGTLVPSRRYSRIVSTNLAADRLLLELASPDQVLAFTRASRERPLHGYRYAGRPLVDGFGPVEELIALRPDLVLSNSLGTPGRATKLRAAGIEVFDFGELRGVSSLVQVATTMGQLLGEPERGQNFARTFAQRMNSVAAGLADRPRKRALVLLSIGGQVLGGTVGTALHDILVAAGLLDVAAAGYRDWPTYSAEQLLALSPDLIVTKQGMSTTVCGFPGADHLPACTRPGQIVELPGEWLDEPGPAMLDAAEEIYRQVYGGAR